jgi:hypothetical protein
MLGSELVATPEGVAVCDIALPLRPHSGSIARPAAKSDEDFISYVLPKAGTGNAHPGT